MARNVEDLKKALAQLFIVGFDGTELSRDLRDLFRHYPPGGVILFKRNLEDPDQIHRLTRELQEPGTPLPTLVCIDQEGGRVWRLPPDFTFFPEAQALGNAEADSLAHSAAKVIAEELAAVGIHCNFAPVLDLHTNPKNPVIGDRSFGSDPVAVTALARSVLLSFRAHGIAGCGKHFPGHGDTDLDSHETLPTVSMDRNRLWSVEMAPYRMLARDTRRPLELVMTAHVRYPELDPKRPATLSRRILRGALRGQIGFDGLIVTDDLEMGAITETYGPDEAALLSFRAGADFLMFCHTPFHLPACIETLCRSLKRGETSYGSVSRSLSRIERFKKRLRYRLPDGSVRSLLFRRIGCAEHR
ncbi:MAG: beta-N-acetylhexosaminidase, partial [Thermodesulfobacteriota bacterium]